MNSIKLIFTIVEFISVLVLVVNGNLVTLNGQCPFDSLQPSPLAVKDALRGKFNAIAVTSPGLVNRSDVHLLYEPTNSNEVKLTYRFYSKENLKCEEFFIFLTPLDRTGVYDAYYQVAPGTNFVHYTAYILVIDPVTLRAVIFICHNLPNLQYQAEIIVTSAFTTAYDFVAQEQIKELLKENRIENLEPFIVEVEQNQKCEFRYEEIFKSFGISK